MAETPEQSKYTFIKERSHQFKQNPDSVEKGISKQDV
jgi:hypothetical protein